MLASLSPANDRIQPGATIKPAQYLRLRREAAGLSRMELGHRLYAIKVKRPFSRTRRRLFESVDQALSAVEQLELPGARSRYRPVIHLLSGVFPLDPDVYFQLVHEPADRLPAICHECGCSKHDACGSICTLHDDICTRCVAASRKLAA